MQTFKLTVWNNEAEVVDTALVIADSIDDAQKMVKMRECPDWARVQIEPWKEETEQND